MSLFQTSTPDYGGQNGHLPVRQPEWLEFVLQLFRTPTPNYLPGPGHSAHKARPAQPGEGPNHPDR